MNDCKKKLLEELALVQNMPHNQNRDIMTIAYLMDENAIKMHIENCKRSA